MWHKRNTLHLVTLIAGTLLTGKAVIADDHDWHLRDGSVIRASYVSFVDGKVTTRLHENQTFTWDFDELAPPDQQHVLRLEDTPQPRRTPPWIEGYRVRYTLRVVGQTGDAGDLLVTQPAQTVIARVPTGGWLTDDARDLIVTTVTGKRLPMAVLTHDPGGDTIIQFLRHGHDRWYWLYASNPDEPGEDPAFTERVEHARQRAQQAGLTKMEAMNVSALRAGAYRDIFMAIDEHHKTLGKVASELAEWGQLLPQRVTDAKAAAQKLAAAQQALQLAAEAHAPFEKMAQEKTALAEKLKKEADAAAEQNNANDDAQKNGGEGGQEKTQPDPQLAAAANKAAEMARAARLAAAPTGTTKTRAQAAIKNLHNKSRNANHSLEEANKRIKQAAQLKADTEQALHDLEPKLAPARDVSVAARAAARLAVEQTKADGDAYTKLAMQRDPRVLQEGLTVEYRRWEGDDLGSWASVIEGLKASDSVIGSAVLGQVHQHVNPFRRGDPRQFAASYRGYLNIEQPGVYRFFINSDDAVFLFINDFRIFSRTGSNRPVDGKIKLLSIGTDIELEKGRHRFEIHQVVGNAPDAKGLCKIRWILPGERSWKYIPPDAFVRALSAVPIGVEAFDGGQVAAFDHGMDDTLQSDGLTVFLSRFEAQGSITDPQKLTWQFGDGTAGTGRSPTHVYFKRGQYAVTLKSHPKLPPFRRICHQWISDMPTSPLALGKAVDALESIQIEKLDAAMLHDMLHFLLICEQPTRWPLMERLCRHLLAQKGLDVKYRAHLYTSLMLAMAHQERGDEALKLLDPAVKELAAHRTLRAMMMLHAGHINRDFLRDFDEADRHYSQVIQENHRLRHPLIRAAAVAWGDMFMQAGQIAEAADAYRLARSLGTVSPIGEGQGDATKLGALQRMAQQQLRRGDIRQTQRLLDQIETDFPEQRINALYRFLRADAQRHAGQYEPALRNYAMVLTLPSGRSYRPQVLYGMADTNYRMGESDQTLELLKSIFDSYPDVYRRRRIASFQKRIESRRDRLRLAMPDSKTKPKLFAGLATGFEPDESPTQHQPAGARVIPTMGIDGPHTAFIETHGIRKVRLPIQRMHNVATQGSLWIELWYREHLTVATGDGQLKLWVSVREDTGRHIASPQVWPYRTYGQWHKAGFAVNAPTTLDGSVGVTVQGNGATLEIDGLKIMPVSDAQDYAFRNFMEGADPQ